MAHLKETTTTINRCFTVWSSFLIVHLSVSLSVSFSSLSPLAISASFIPLEINFMDKFPFYISLSLFISHTHSLSLTHSILNSYSLSCAFTLSLSLIFRNSFLISQQFKISLCNAVCNSTQHAVSLKAF